MVIHKPFGTIYALKSYAHYNYEQPGDLEAADQETKGYFKKVQDAL